MFDTITESFDLEKTNEYTLSIQISLDGFSFSVYNPQENKVIAFKCSPIKISGLNLILRHFSEWVEAEELLQKNYLKTSLIYFTTEFSLIPESLFISKLVHEATNRLTEENKLKTPVINSIEGLNTLAKILFYIPTDLAEFIKQKFSSSELIHPVQFVIKSIPDSSKNNKVILLYNKKSSLMVASRNNQILLANGFNINHSNDLVYYTLNTLMQLNLNLKETELFIAEALVKDEKTEQLLHPYFADISDLQTPENVVNTELIKNSIHRYFPNI